MTLLRNTLTEPNGSPLNGWLDVAIVGNPFRPATQTEVLGPIKDQQITGGAWSVDLAPGLYVVTQRRRDGAFHSRWTVQVPDSDVGVWLADHLTAVPGTPASVSLRAVTSTVVDADGRLQITYSDGTTADAGPVLGPQGRPWTGSEAEFSQAVADEVADETSAAAGALRADFVPSSGDSSIAGKKTFTTGAKVTRLAVGNHTLDDARQPAGVNLVIDGSTLPATPLTNKTGSLVAVTFQGGFTAEAGFGVVDPGHLFGANDYIITGTAAGDLAGATDMWGRLSEVHLRTPGASLAQLFGFSGQAAIEGTAAGSSVTWLASMYAPGPRNSAGAAVTNAASLYTLSGTAGAATNLYNIYAGGTAANFFGGRITANDGLTVNGPSGGFKVTATTPNIQAAAAGVYAGLNTGFPGIELANGTDNIRLDNAGAALFRILKAGVTSQFEIDTNGHAKHRGGLGLFNTTPITAKRTSSANATDLATALTLLNEIKADLQAIGLKA